MMNRLKQILAEVPLYTDDRPYVIIHLPARAVVAAAGVLAEVGEAFSVMIADKDEVTLVLAEEIWENFKRARLPEHRVAPGRFRLITFDLPLEPDLVGFMAAVSGALAEAGISLMAFSAYERDHLLVPSNRFDAARSALQAALQK